MSDSPPPSPSFARWSLVLLGGLAVIAAAWLVLRLGPMAWAPYAAGVMALGWIGLPVLLLSSWRRWVGAIAGFALLLVSLGAVVKLRFGGGKPYPDLATPPLLADSALEPLVKLEYPPGNVAVSADGRVFFAYHPFAKAQRFAPATVFELVAGVPQPFPDLAFQPRYQGVFGMTVDKQNRLWMIEPASLDHERTQLMAIDLERRSMVFEYRFPVGAARFAQDLRVSPDGETVYLADTGLFKFTPASLIVFEVQSKTFRTVLAGDDTAQPQDWVIQTPFGPHRLAFGMLTFAVGLDGIALSSDGSWLTYGAMNHDRMYKVPTSALRDPAQSPQTLAQQRVELGPKPLSDGITLDAAGNVIITDVEHGGLAQLSSDGKLQTLVRSPKVIWADGVAMAPDGSMVFTDSAIPAYIHQLALPPSLDKLAAGRPYFIYRVRPSAER